VYYLDIVAIRTTLSWTRGQALSGRAGTAGQEGQRVLLTVTGTVGLEDGREVLAPCGLTNLLEQTKCQSVLALAERARMVARKVYIFIKRNLCMTLCYKINEYHMNL
jgi:hypothetical protein